MVAAVLMGIVIVFQLALVLGAPWGAASWGGQRAGTLPSGLRAASAAAAVILAVLAWIVLATADVVDAPWPSAWNGPATWVATAYFAIGTLVNAISRSRVERLWAPVAGATAICCGIVALA